MPGLNDKITQEMESPMDLLSLTFHLRPVASDPSRPLPEWWGAAVQSLLFEVLREASPQEVGALHDDPSAPRPFTVSTLMGPRPRGGTLDPEATYSFRLTTLQAGLSDILYQAIQPGQRLSPGSRMELDYLPFSIEQVGTAASGDSWVGETSYQDLASMHLLSPQPPSRQIVLELASPTAFRSNDRVQPLPLPRMVFHSLWSRWNAFAPTAFPQETQTYAEECLAISRFDLHSRPVSINGGMRIGAVGRMAYTTLNYDRYWMSILHTLAAYARFSGIGILTAAGMGQSRAITVG